MYTYMIKAQNDRALGGVARLPSLALTIKTGYMLPLIRLHMKSKV